MGSPALDFPSLPSTSPPPSILGAPPSLVPPALPAGAPTSFWKDLLFSDTGKNIDSSLSYIPPSSEEICFTEEELNAGQKEWMLSLMGYAIGKRPFYGSLLAAIKKKWNLKGSFELLTLSGDFFLFKFTCQEDFDLVWDGGPCFLNGRPFVFQKWSRDFSPSKEHISEIPLWIKLPDFPLCCWNQVGFSKVASKVGIPLAVDSLTATKARISFARVCVQITATSPLPESVVINLNGSKHTQPIIYDWKPTACTSCQCFSHDIKSCPLNPSHNPTARGRSLSRKPPLAQRRGSGPIKDSLPVAASHMPTSAQSIPHFAIQPSPSSNAFSPLNDLNLAPISSPPLDEEAPASNRDPLPRSRSNSPNESSEVVPTSVSDPNQHDLLPSTASSSRLGTGAYSTRSSEHLSKTSKKPLPESSIAEVGMFVGNPTKSHHKKKGKLPASPSVSS